MDCIDGYYYDYLEILTLIILTFDLFKYGYVELFKVHYKNKLDLLSDPYLKVICLQ